MRADTITFLKDIKVGEDELGNVQTEPRSVGIASAYRAEWTEQDATLYHRVVTSKALKIRVKTHETAPADGVLYNGKRYNLEQLKQGTRWTVYALTAWRR